MADGKNNEIDTNGFKSPARKLIVFFRRSRDKWKLKCQEAKYKIKLLKQRLSYMQKRRLELKSKISELENELRSAQTREETLIDEIDRLKKTQR